MATSRKRRKKSGESAQPDPELVAFGQRLKAGRDARELTQGDLASLAGCDTQNVSKIERGIHAPNSRLLASLCAALKVSSDWLLFGTGPGPKAGAADVDAFPSLARFVAAQRLTPSEAEHLRKATGLYQEDPGEGTWLQHLGILRSIAARHS